MFDLRPLVKQSSDKIISTGLKETSHYGYIDTEGKLSIAIEEIRQAMQKGETIAVVIELSINLVG